MGKSSERTDVTVNIGGHRSTEGFRVSRDDSGSTSTYHGYEGQNQPHYTEHRDGSRWKTDTEGKKTRID